MTVEEAIEKMREFMREVGKEDNQRVAIRSSGLAEDLPGASFAGQYSTVLNVPLEKDEVINAILECASSVWSKALCCTRRSASRSILRLGRAPVRASAARIMAST